jgi:6-phosphogluconolactonase (cycloisomerase 2 family)
VYVTARTSDTFVVFSRNAATGAVAQEDTFTNGVGGVTGLDYPYGIVVSPDGRYIYVTGYNSDALVTFSRDGDGVVSYQDTLIDVTNLYNPYVPTISPDGRHLYITGGNTSADDGYVTVYERNMLYGSVMFVQRRYEGQPIGFLTLNGLGQAWGIAVSPDGNHVYVAGHLDDTVVRFTRNSFDGKLTYNGIVSNSLMQVQNIEGTQSIEAINAEGLDGARDVKFSPDGQYLYVTASVSDALSVFGRNPANGNLTQVQVIYGNGNNPALDGAWELGVSPDGTAVYATGTNNNSVVALHSANPLATLSTLLPASAQAGSPETTVRVQGAGFVPGAVVRVGNVARTSTYISPNEMKVAIPASDLTIAGTTWTIDVVNPEPGGGVSNNFLIFTVTDPADNPIPSIDYLQPQGAGAGDAALTLTVHGFNFMNSSKLRWNGEDRATTFVNSGEVNMTVTAQDLLSAGSAVVTVFNPGPGGGLSNAVLFDVAAQGQNPVPTITGIAPDYTNARGAASKPRVVVVTGQNFMQGSQGRWNGADRPTVFVSETELKVTLNAFDTAYGGSGAITVYNPPALPDPPNDGGVSNPATFTIYQYALYLPLVAK